MQRRQFLQMSGSSLAMMGLSTAPLFAANKLFAQTGSPLTNHNFIFIRVDGGWDTSLGLEPWTDGTRPDANDFFIEYQADQLLEQDGRYFGPALAPLKKYFSKMTLINGIYVSPQDGGHDSAGAYMETGNGQGNLALFPVELEGLGFNSRLGIMTEDSLILGHRLMKIWNTQKTRLKRKVEPADLIFSDNAPGSALDSAKDSLIQNAKRIALFNSKLSEILTPDISQEKLMAVSLSLGLSQTAYFRMHSNSLDTHSDHPKRHLELQKKVFEQINSLLELLAFTQNSQSPQKSLLDTTTIVVASEFSRTPALNASGGKDHNPQTNSMMIFSPFLRPATLGASHLVDRATSPTQRPYLVSLPLHSETFAPTKSREGTFILRPESIYATLAKSFSVEPERISQGLGGAKILSPLLLS